MTVRTLLRTHLHLLRRRIAVLVLVLVVLPGVVATGSLLFADVVPRDVPVAVVPGEDAGAEDVELTRATLDLFAQPVTYESEAAAFRSLDREQVYGVVVVPGGLTEGGSTSIELSVDGRVVPYIEPSGAIASAVESTLDRNLDADVRVEHVIRGQRVDLAAYLFPTFLFAFLGVLAFAYLPYVLAREAEALDRIRVESSLESYLATKLIVFTTLSLVPLAVFALVAAILAYPITLLDPTAVAVSMVIFLTFAATSSAITFLTGFSTAGRLANVLVLFGLLGLSGAAYPAGFFSPGHRELVRTTPTHYAMVLLRNATLKDLGGETYPAAVAVVLITALGTLALAKLSLGYHRRRT